MDPRTACVRIEFIGLPDDAGATESVRVAGLTLARTDGVTLEQTLEAYLAKPTPPPPAHPWMICTPNELPELRERSSVGPGLVIWRHLLAQCERHYYEQRPVDPPKPVRQDRPGFDEAYCPQTGHYGDCLRGGRLTPMYALAAVVTERQRYIDKAVEWLTRPLDWPEWCVREPDGWHVGAWDICVGRKLGEMGLAYDMMHAHLDDQQRERIVETLASYANLLVDSVYRPEMRYGQGRAYSPNTQTNIACLGLCGLALLGDHPDAGRWLQFARFFFKEIALTGGDYLAADGGDELGYEAYACWINAACAFLHCLQRLAGEDLFGLPAMRRTAQFGLYGHIPPNRMLPLGTTEAADTYYDLRHAMAALARHQDSADAWSFVAGSAPIVTAPDTARYPDLGNEFDLGNVVHGGPAWMFLWAGEPPPGSDSASPETETNLPPRHLAPALPKSRVFPDTGLAVLRSGWSRDDLVLALRCGGRWNRDRDSNHLILDGFGGPLLVGPRPRDGETIETNAYLVDGRGQDQHIPGCIGWVGTPAGSIVRSFLSRTVDYVVGDARYAYLVDGRHLRTAERHVVYLRPDAFVIRDRLATEEQRRVRFDLLLHPGGTCRQRARSLQIERPGGLAAATFLSPDDLCIDQGASVEAASPSYAIHPASKTDELDVIWSVVAAPTGRSPAHAQPVETESALGARVGDDWVLWSKRPGRCRAASVVFDGDLVVVRADGSWTVVGGRRLEVAGTVKLDEAEPRSRTGR